jgi:phosphatidylinositol alpha 1,6-mannosyltransferase
MADLRLALFTGNYNHIKDGVSLTLNRLVQYLEQQGVPVVVFGPTIDQPALEHRGKLISVPSIPVPGRSEYRLSVGFPNEVREELQDFEPTLIHIATPDLLGYRALRFAQANEIQVVASYHTHFTSYLKYYNLQMLESLGWKYLSWFYNQCRHVYVPSPSMAEELNRQGINNGVRIWARGVDTDLFHPEKRSVEWRKKHGFSEEHQVVTFVSRLVWEKDLRTFVDVVQKMQERKANVRSMIVGDGPAYEELQKMLPETVFTGFLTGEELATAYASSDLFLFPSDTETFGNVTLEAMSCGLPCVVADATGSKSLVEPGVNGLLASPRDADAFYCRVEQILSDREMMNTMREASRQKALAYAWENVNSELLNNYHQALSEPVPTAKL